MKECSLRPYQIEQRFKLRTPIYRETAAYGHMGRNCEVKSKTFKDGSGKTKVMKVELFPWEKDNLVSLFKKTFKVK
jgi:S-adenosylmethionine synthetase